jgi:hypothetical protein
LRSSPSISEKNPKKSVKGAPLLLFGRFANLIDHAKQVRKALQRLAAFEPFIIGSNRKPFSVINVRQYVEIMKTGIGRIQSSKKRHELALVERRIS